MNEEVVDKIKKRVALEEKAYRIVVELSESTLSDDVLISKVFELEHYNLSCIHYKLQMCDVNSDAILCYTLA